MDYPKLFSIKPLDLTGRLSELIKLIKREDGSKLDFVLTFQQFKDWKDLIMHAVNCTRLYVQNLDQEKFPDYIKYYKECWEKIDEAKNDDELSKAIGHLAMSMYYQ